MNSENSTTKVDMSPEAIERRVRTFCMLLEFSLKLKAERESGRLKWLPAENNGKDEAP